MSILWSCHQCNDGPKIWPINVQCVICGHVACEYCPTYKDSGTLGAIQVPAGGAARSGSFAKHPDPVIERPVPPPSTTHGPEDDAYAKAPSVGLARIRQGRGASILHEKISAIPVSGAPKALTLESHHGQTAASRAQGADPVQLEHFNFAHLWETSVLPVILRRIPPIVRSSFSLDVIRDSKRVGDDIQDPGATPVVRRVILFTSPHALNEEKKNGIKSLISIRLPEHYQSYIRHEFVVGKVRRCCDTVCGKSEDDPDVSCFPKRMFHQQRPLMGASIGLIKKDSAGTLGGYVRINGMLDLGLTCDHIFETKDEMDKMHPTSESINDQVVQPSYLDFPAKSEEFGLLAYASGYGKRPSKTRSAGIDEEIDMVRTDWALVTVEERRQGLNAMAKDDYLRDNVEVLPEAQSVLTTSTEVISCGGVGKVIPDQLVHTAGRTSGYQQSRVTLTKSWVHYDDDNNDTFEWGLYRDYQQHAEWIVNGPGQPGDSGTWVIEKEHNTFLGMIFSRGPVWGVGRRIAYFSTAENIEADIREALADKKLHITSMEILKPVVVNTSIVEKETISAIATPPTRRRHHDRAVGEASIPAKRPTDQIENDLFGVAYRDPSETVSVYQPQWDVEDDLSQELEIRDSQTASQTATRPFKPSMDSKKEKQRHSVVAPQVRVIGVSLPWGRRHLPVFTIILPVR
jgi:hypothetical protein